MQIKPASQSLTQKSLTHCRILFSTLEAPSPGALSGVYQAKFTGPGWLRKTAAPTLGLAHFAGWWGKQFQTKTSGANLFYRKGQFIQDFPFTLAQVPSLVDGKDGLSVHYAHEAAFPWAFVVDELRWLEPGCLLGMTVIDAGLLRKLAFPFLLHARENMSGL